MAEFTPDSLATIAPAELAKLVKDTPDKDLREIMAGDLRVPNLDAIFGRFPQLFHPEKAKDASAQVNFKITGGPGDSSDTYGVIVKDGACTVEKEPESEPTTSLMLGPVEFFKLITGNGNPVMMVMSGKVKARGDLGVAMAFSNWFDISKA
jgi:putative sterol carrier protein